MPESVSAPPSSTLGVLDWIDDVADRFESAWREGLQPRLADFVGDEKGDCRAVLLAELIKIDLAYRTKGGERRRIEDYVREFPALLRPDGTLPDELVLYACHAQEAASDRGSATVSLRCPECGERVTAAAGGRITCANCGGALVVEGAAPGAARVADLPRTLGRFQLLELVGRGAFGAVYKARDAELDRVVAVKLPRSGCFNSAEEEERFLREARNTAQLQHPNIVPVHEIARAGDLPFIVSDFIEGRTLAQNLAERRFGFRATAQLIGAIADALDYAHRRGVVHRDVNPRNVLLDAAGQPHVTDFGLARRDERGIFLTLDGQILGTPAYMSPEQAAGRQIDVNRRSDVYSLGVVLYEMLTGDVPFRGTVTMLFQQVLNDEPRPPRKLNNHVPRDLETICLKAMEKTPARRYATADALAADLRRYLAGEPIHARSVGPLERAWRWCRRKPLVAALTAASVVLLLAATIAAMVTAVTSHRALERERDLLSQNQVRLGLALLENRNAVGLFDLLEACRKVAMIPEARAERSRIWSGWYGSCAGRLQHLVSHEAAVQDACFLPDGRHFLTMSVDGAVQCWEAATGLPAGSPIAVRPPGDNELASLLQPDGRRMAVVALDGQVRFWQPDSGQLVNPEEPVWARAGAPRYSPRGSWLLVTNEVNEDTHDLTVALVDASTGRRLRTLTDLPKRASVIAVSPDEQLLATMDGDGRMSLRDSATGRLCARCAAHPSSQINLAAFSPDGKILATAEEDHAVRLWNVPKGTLRHALVGHGEDVRAFAFSPDGAWLATASFDGAARLWDVASGRTEHELRHDGPVLGVKFSPGGELVATASFDATAQVWEVRTGRLRGWPLRHQSMVKTVAFSPDGARLLTASQDRTARVWDLNAGKPRVLIHPARVYDVAFSPAGDLLVTASMDGSARLWRTDSGTPLGAPLRPPAFQPGERTEMFNAAFHPSGEYCATAGTGIVQVWHVATAQPFGPPLHVNTVRYVQFSPDGDSLATTAGGTATETSLWDWRTGKRRCPPVLLDGEYKSCVFSRDGRWLAVASSEYFAQVFDAATLAPQTGPLHHGGRVEAVAFSPQGFLATADRDLLVRFWDPATGAPCRDILRPKSPVQSVAFSPDGTFLATAAVDGAVRLWDVATGLPCAAPFAHSQFATSVAFSPDGRFLATGSFDKTAKLWQLSPAVNDLREMELRTWLALGARLNELGGVEPFSWRLWQDLRRAIKQYELERTP